MPSPALQTAPAQGGNANTTNQAAAPPTVPFIRASMEHVEPMLDVTLTPTTAAQAVAGGPVDVPAYGYLRSLLVFVAATGGTGAAAVYKEDAPWSAIQDITLLDVNGAPIVVCSGYSLYLLNKYGGYNYASNPTTYPFYVTPATTGNFAFAVRVPVEIGRRDGLGSLPNSNASATYKLRLTLAALSAIYSTNPTGIPTIRFRVFTETWAQPTPTGLGGAVNAMQPAATGTTQFWSETSVAVNSGLNRIRLPRVGNLIRNIILVNRDSATGTRATGEGYFPTDFTVDWDSHQMVNESSDVNKHYIAERFGYSTVDNGVRVLSFTHDFDGHAGGELRDLWIPTTQSTRLEVAGTFTTAASNLTILTNDVAPIGNVWL